MKISTPEIKVIRFSSEDVIVASSSLTGVNGLFYIPSGQYSSGYSGSGDFVEFSGTIGSAAIPRCFQLQWGILHARKLLRSILEPSIIAFISPLFAGEFS